MRLYNNTTGLSYAIFAEVSIEGVPMNKLAISALLLALLGACAATDETRVNPNLMTDEEIIAYNKTQDRIWDQIHCAREFSTRSHIKKRYCGTLSQINRRAASTGEQLNIISFGTPQIYR